MPHFIRLRLISVLSVSCLVLVLFCLASNNANAQGGMGAGGGGGQGGTPAFVEPKFRDRVWEEGGPRTSGLRRGGKLVKGIQIIGNQSISRHKILSHMQTRPDRNYDEKRLQADIHELYRTDLFRKITPSLAENNDGIFIRLEVVEQPTVTEVIFQGNRGINDSMLEKHCGIKVGDPANAFSTDMARQRLIDLYMENGFNQVAIVVKEGNKAGDRRLYFDISEGPLERIWHINFVGNEQFSSALLATKIKSKDANYGVTSYIMNVADKNKIEEDKNRLTGYYRSLGYFTARVDFQIKYYDDGDFLDLTFVIAEGPRFKVRNVSVVGNKFFPTDVLMPALEMKSGEFFHLGEMHKDQRTLRNEFYGREGFVFVDIVPEPRFLEEPGQLDIVYRITEGDRYRAGQINVHIAGDSSHTQHNVVLNLLGIREGEYIDLQEMENSERRLKASQIFEVNPTLGEPPRIEVRSPDRPQGF
ncbi:MAG: POTRA domain-containing protein [Planctomycetota bacterium]